MILYVCNDYFVDYNYTLQAAMVLANAYSIPLVVVLLRPEDEYVYPFSPHSCRLFHHLSHFREQLLSLHITPLLLFTSSYTTSLLHLHAALSPLFLLTETPRSLPDQFELSLLLTQNPSFSSSLLLVRNTPPLPTPLSPSSLLPPSSLLASLTSHFLSHLTSPTPTPPPPTLDPFTQLRVAYSLTTEESFLSRSDTSLLPDFSSCELILPPFLTTPPPHLHTPSQPSDFCYGTDRQVRERVGNWGDIQHEVRWMDSRPYWQQSVREMLESEKGYYPYYRGSVANSAVYRVVGRLRAGFVSVYSVRDACVACANNANSTANLRELAGVVAVDAYTHAYFGSHLSGGEEKG